MKVLHCPVVIADNSVVIAKYLRRLGVDARVVSYFRTWLGYEGDVNLELDQLGPAARAAKVREYIDRFFEREVQDLDIVHFHFLDTLSTGYSFGGWRSHPDRPPFWDLKRLRDMGKKVVVSVVGSEVRNNSKFIRYQLKYLRPDLDLPAPPLGRRFQYASLWQFAKYAGAIVCADSETMKHVPYSLRILHPIDLEPLEPYRTDSAPNGPVSILHAPSNDVIKGTSFILPVLEKIKNRYNGRVEVQLIRGVPHDQALGMYAGQGLAVDQINLSFGLFATEAMYLGRPVICSLRSEEFLPDDPKVSAPVISVNSPDDFLAAIEAYLDDNLSAGREEMADYVTEHHGADRVAAQYKALYEELLSGQRPAFHFSQEWLQEFDLVAAGHSPDEAGYYSKVGDALLALRDLPRLRFEITMGRGMSNEVEALAKLCGALEGAGQPAQARQLYAQNEAVAASEAFRAAVHRARHIWDTGQI